MVCTVGEAAFETIDIWEFSMGIQNDPSKKYSNMGGFQVGFARFVLINIQISMVNKGGLRDSP